MSGNRLTPVAEDAAGRRAIGSRLKLAKGTPATWRSRIGDWRVIFRVSADRMLVISIDPRGGAYD